jgi:hypothetical protein
LGALFDPFFWMIETPLTINSGKRRKDNIINSLLEINQNLALNILV